MKRRHLTTFATLGFFLALAIAPAHTHAQTINAPATANVPFAFSVGDQSFPAGEYRVERLNPQSNVAIFVIRSADGKRNAMFLTSDSVRKAKGDSHITFNRYGERYFLASLWRDANPPGSVLRVSRAERRLRRREQIGAAPVAQMTVALVGRRDR